MNQNKQSGFVKWLLITISVLFLFVMLVASAVGRDNTGI